MNPIFRKSLVASAIAALIATPAWAGETGKDATRGAQAESARRIQTEPSTQGSAARMEGMTGETHSPLYTMTPRELRGTQVVGPGGETIGSVKAVVRGRDQQNIEAVVSSGGFLGIGDKEITIPLHKLQYVDGKLHVSATKDELKASPNYRAEQYVELEPKDQPISEFSAFESEPDRPERGSSGTISPGIERGHPIPGDEGAPRQDSGSPGMTR